MTDNSPKSVASKAVQRLLRYYNSIRIDSSAFVLGNAQHDVYFHGKNFDKPDGVLVKTLASSGEVVLEGGGRCRPDVARAYALCILVSADRADYQRAQLGEAWLEKQAQDIILQDQPDEDYCDLWDGCDVEPNPEDVARAMRGEIHCTKCDQDLNHCDCVFRKEGVAV